MMTQDAPIYALTPFTMLDFKDKTACIIWFAGCNMRCAYCHNPDIVLGNGTKSEEDVLEFLERRRGLLDGVVISGGEANCYKGLPAFLEKIKRMGYAVKLDSNGTYPDTIKYLFENHLIDYVALDYKASACAFQKVTRTGRRLWKNFQTTLEYLCITQKGKFEVRTTVHTALLKEQDINAIISDLEEKDYSGTYYLQAYTHKEDGTLGNMLDQVKVLDTELIQESRKFQIDYRNF